MLYYIIIRNIIKIFLLDGNTDLNTVKRSDVV